MNFDFRFSNLDWKRLSIALIVCMALMLGSMPANAENVTVVSSAATVKSTALEASHVLLAKGGQLVSLHVYNTSVSEQFILIMDSATVPANGAVTLLYPPIRLPAASLLILPFPVPLKAGRGISVCNSSTGTFTKTIGSADCMFVAQVL
jgi:hypothetical protein